MGPRLGGGVPSGFVQRGRLRGLVGFGRGVASLLGHLPHQTLHPPWLQERRRRLGLGILWLNYTVQANQAGDFVLLVPGLVDAGTAARFTDAKMAPVDFHGDNLRC